VLRLEELLEAIGDTTDDLAERGAAVVDHLAAHRLQDIVRTGCRARATEVHGSAPSGGCTGMIRNERAVNKERGL
jgi:hypothetical protein